MADAVIEDLYRATFTDRLITPDENADLISTLQELQTIQDGSSTPPALTPDKLVWVRAAAFRIACEYLVEDGDADDPREENVKLLKTINAVVHALETTCLVPSLEEEGGDNFSKEGIEELFKSLYETEDEDGDGDEDGPVISRAEATALQEFLTDEATRPPLSVLIWLRSTAFRLGSQYLNEENDKAKNVALLRSINVIVHTVETTCMTSRPLTLELPPSHTPDADTDFTTAVQTLWNIDSNRLTPHKDYRMDVQSSKHPSNKGDAANDPLFTHVNRQVFQRPTFNAFRSLLDNYSAYTGDEEEVSQKELRENRAFLNAIMETAPMKYCHRYCLAKEVEYDGEPIPEDESDFKNVLNSIWFQLYSRSGGGRRRKLDSSGFEHVFVGEVKNGQVSGFHNWIMFWLEERKGNIDYRGYIKPRSRDSTAQTNDDDPVLTLQFSWNGVEKFVGTSIIGVSPEFELALYTMAFLAGEDENVVTLDTGGECFDLNVKCHKYDGGSKVGSCYVEALAHYED
eukprot:CAMPEP_0172301444 /NCGR_PEP_ID=MMETSP1058-20130122/3332_1 /TAXON_ID=83371 /ORGANISM="Detonula confervacea, Strain CCMP 353" /LENGTH=513 /DNA_ID=CAMNT_0013011561 /DNA_START=7 /DNA_END=1548 /DNA_ORIENTATION=+